MRTDLKSGRRPGKGRAGEGDDDDGDLIRSARALQGEEPPKAAKGRRRRSHVEGERALAVRLSLSLSLSLLRGHEQIGVREERGGRHVHTQPCPTVRQKLKSRIKLVEYVA